MFWKENDTTGVQEIAAIHGGDHGLRDIGSEPLRLMLFFGKPRE
jgi:hypothetical protein